MLRFTNFWKIHRKDFVLNHLNAVRCSHEKQNLFMTAAFWLEVRPRSAEDTPYRRVQPSTKTERPVPELARC